jgi:hypothetical protein
MIEALGRWSYSSSQRKGKTNDSYLGKIRNFSPTHDLEEEKNRNQA